MFSVWKLEAGYGVGMSHWVWANADDIDAARAAARRMSFFMMESPGR